MSDALYSLLVVAATSRWGLGRGAAMGTQVSGAKSGVIQQMGPGRGFRSLPCSVKIPASMSATSSVALQ